MPKLTDNLIIGLDIAIENCDKKATKLFDEGEILSARSVVFMGEQFRLIRQSVIPVEITHVVEKVSDEERGP